MAAHPKLSLDQLGPSGGRRLRTLWRAFESAGIYEVGDGPIEILNYLDDHGGSASVRTLAQQVPSVVLARNDVTRAQVTDLLARLAEAA